MNSPAPNRQSLNNEQYFIRNIRQTDLDEIYSIEKRAYKKGWSYGIFQQSLTSNRGFILIRRDTDNIIGYGISQVIVDEFHILNICIHPDYQHQGLGKGLLYFLLDKAREFSCKDVFLEVRASNLIAIQLYLDAGFNEVGIRKNYYPSEKGREDACQMCLSLF